MFVTLSIDSFENKKQKILEKLIFLLYPHGYIRLKLRRIGYVRKFTKKF